MRSIAVLPVNWAKMAVRSIDHKSAFKMNFNILCIFIILKKKFMHIEYTLLNGYKKVLLLGFMFLILSQFIFSLYHLYKIQSGRPNIDHHGMLYKVHIAESVAS